MKDAFSPSRSADSSCQHCSNRTSVMTGRALTRTAQGHAEWLGGIRLPLLVKQGLMKHSAPPPPSPNSHPHTSECLLMTSVSVFWLRLSLFFLYRAVLPLAYGLRWAEWPPPNPPEWDQTFQVIFQMYFPVSYSQANLTFAYKSSTLSCFLFFERGKSPG